MAAGDTSGTVIRNVMILISKTPELGEKLYEELSQLDFRPKTLKDAPLLAATLNEALRFIPSIYRSLFHTTTKVYYSIHIILRFYFFAEIFRVVLTLIRRMFTILITIRFGRGGCCCICCCK